MTENKRFTLRAYDGLHCDVFDGEIEIAEVHRDDGQGLVDLLNNLHEENQAFKQVFEKAMENAFDRYMDSRIAEEVIDYIHDSFYELLEKGDLK